MARWFQGIRRRRTPPPASDPRLEAAATALPGSWVGPADADGLIAATPELRRLLESWGFSPDLERRWPGLWAELKGLVRSEVRDFAAFRAALVQVEAQLQRAAAAADGDLLAAAWRSRAGDDLLTAVLAAGDDEARVLWALDRDPVDRVLPFIEEIPFLSQGEVTWRLPIEIPVLRKRPADPERFGELLDELERGAVEEAGRGADPERREVLEALGRLRRVLERGNAYLPAPLKALEGRVEDWLHRSQPPEGVARRRELEGLLGGLAGARHRFGTGRPLEPSEAAAFREIVQGLAGRYAGAPWLHTPWLTRYALATLLASELAPFATREGSRQSAPEGVLRLVFDEVTGGRHDPAESARRLRVLEEKGLYVHSLAYTLLRLGSS